MTDTWRGLAVLDVIDEITAIYDRFRVVTLDPLEDSIRLVTHDGVEYRIHASAARRQGGIRERLRELLYYDRLRQAKATPSSRLRLPGPHRRKPAPRNVWHRGRR